MQKLEIQLSGRFRVLGPDGSDLTPRGAKEQGCLALIATSNSLNRSRVWLANKLWSDRDSERARGSLRQALKSIRNALKDQSSILESNRGSVWLDPAEVSILRNPDEEFLEGIDISDPEWSDWLTWERASDHGAESQGVSKHMGPLANASLTGTSLDINLIQQGGNSCAEQYLSGQVAERFAQGLEETFGINTYFSGLRDGGLTLHVTPLTQDGANHISLSLTDGEYNRHIWSGRRRISLSDPVSAENIELSAMLFEGQDALVANRALRMTRTKAPADIRIAIQLAIQKTLSFRTEHLLEAHDALSDICDCEDNAQALAWYLFAARALHYEVDRSAFEIDEALLIGRCEKALGLAPTSAFVIAMVSAVFLRVLGRQEDGVLLAKRALKLNPNNPFAIEAVAGAFYLGDRIQEGYRLSCVATKLVSRSRFAPHFQMSQCVGATVLGEFDDASNLAMNASAMAPHLKSAWRFRLALNAHVRDARGVEHAQRQLKLLEGDFCARNMLEDPKYPVPSIRRSSLDLSILR